MGLIVRGVFCRCTWTGCCASSSTDRERGNGRLNYYSVFSFVLVKFGGVSGGATEEQLETTMCARAMLCRGLLF